MSLSSCGLLCISWCFVWSAVVDASASARHLLRAGFLCCVLVGQVGQGIVMFHVDET
jgi:hypothetical protein